MMMEKEAIMPEIILTEEQARVIRDAREPVILTDTAGTVRIVSEPFDAAALAGYHLDKRSGIEPEGIPAELVKFYLKALDAERTRRGRALNENEIDEFIASLEKAEAA